ncbi:hypothetical protein A1OK_22080 [Enterovibrio norvegicus FF-454]|uniref:Glycosyltransferase RgtA/B/C/D-like domain-containing protein n=1 Tax=Enterovibrio norvegicus FF-454 TaxID=1185651 RepID=A0A1E5C6I4_9GAMM|nr:hypothetical protein [Enterovibrio norvegicus]OEE61100.1 hypothetical protein A1OK_22080 [Enterovibrio norvegicus FF-454]
MHNTVNKNLLLYVFTAIFFVPMIILNRDLWDGVIISHAFVTKNTEIYWNWFTETGWFLTPYMYDVFYHLFSEANFLQIFYIFFLFCHVFSAHQIYILSHDVFDFGEWPSLTASAIFALSPLWNIYFSTVFLMHAFTLALALYCINRLLKYRTKTFIIFSIISLLAFQQASIPPIIIAILGMEYLLQREKKKIPFILGYVLLSVAFFMYTRYSFPAHGLYESYNGMNVGNIFEWGHYKVFLQYIQEVYPLFALLLIISVFLTDNRYKVLLFTGLIFAAIIPFIVVGKPPWPSHLFVTEGWEQRQAITLTVSISLIFGLVHMILRQSKYKFLALSVYISIAVLSLKFYSSVEVKVKSVLIQDALVSLFKENTNAIGECGIVLTVDAPPAFRNLSSYELSYLTWQAFGQRKYIYLSSRKPTSIDTKDIYRDKYILPDEYPKCMKNASLLTNIDELKLYELFTDQYLKQSLEIKTP